MTVVVSMLSFLAGMVFWFILGTTSLHTLGEDGYLKPLLIKEECANYDTLTGKFIIKNQR